MILQKTIQDVFATAKVEEVIGDFINLRRRGVNMIGNCPFHDEKTPSFTVSPTKNIYKCFGCGKGGDPVRFVMDHEKISFPEAIRYLAEKYNIVIEETENTDEEIAKKLVTDSLYIVNDFAKEYYSDNLFNRAEGKSIGLAYFKQRGFRENTIEKFGLGYALDERDELTQRAINKKYNIEHLRAVGLTTRNDQDFFRSRVIFTIHNVSGKVIAFAGRTLSADKKIPKYINSPDTEIYNKRAVLYGLYFAKEAIRKEDECILVEGYTDVITLHQGDIKNVVASSGTSLTYDQIRLIKRYTPNIKIIYDGDAAGIKAALRGLDLVLEADMNVKLVLLPDGQDPDSFLAAQGTSAFQDYLKANEEDFIFFKTRILLEESGDDPIRKTAVIRDVVNSIALIPDGFKRTLYIRQCSNLLDLAEDMLNAEVNKVIKANRKKVSFANQNPTAETEGYPASSENEYLNPRPSLSKEQPEIIRNDAWQERQVCAILVNYADKIYNESNQISIGKHILDMTSEMLTYFDVPLYKTIIETSLKDFSEEVILDSNYYIQHIDEEIASFAIDALTSPYTYANWESKEMFLQTQKIPEENYVRDIDDALLRLQLKKTKHLLKELKTYFDNATDEAKETEDYQFNLKMLLAIIKERNTLTQQLRMVTMF